MREIAIEEFGLPEPFVKRQFSWRRFAVALPINLICRKLIAALSRTDSADQEEALVLAFVQGAKWWEWESTDWTMWQSDQRKAAKEARRKLGRGTLGRSWEEAWRRRSL